MRIINQIEKIKNNYDYIFIDLAPGTSYSVMDYFLFADIPILVATPDITSIMNVAMFMKNALFRNLNKVFKDNHYVKEKIATAKKDKEGATSLNDIMENMNNEEDKNLLEKTLQEFRPKLIINMIDKDSTGNNIGKMLANHAKKYMNIEVETLGYLYNSEDVKTSISRMMPFVLEDSQSKSSICVRNIANKLL